MAIVAIGFVMSFVSDAFMTERNMFNITRNFAFFGIMALGMSAVICTASPGVRSSPRGGRAADSSGET